MKTLYLDNIRGFKEAAIPISDVTFLVGENSTGKSTFLSVLHMLSRSGFLREYDFDSEDYHMGGFRDLVSSGSSEKSRFTIGYARYIKASELGNKDKFDDPDELIPSCFFVSLESDEGLPVSTRFSYVEKGCFISVRIATSGLYFKTKYIGPPSDCDCVDPSVVVELARLHKASSMAGYKKMKYGPERWSGLQRLKLAATYLSWNSDDDDPTFCDPWPYIVVDLHPVWIAPIRAKPKRIYDGSKTSYSAEGDHTPYMIRKAFNRGTKARLFQERLEKCGIGAHLFEGVHVNRYGGKDYGPFEVQVEVTGSKHSIANVGYGVSQALPIMVEGISQPDNSELYIQQPEVHLHPRAQAELGSLLWSLHEEDSKRFIVETHSDYLIDRFRQEIGRSEFEAKVSVLYFERNPDGSCVTRLEIGSNGKYPEDQPKGFREFFIRESVRNLSI